MFFYTVQQLEVLFVSADEVGKGIGIGIGIGIGTKLFQLTTCDYDVRELCVYEQNPNARKFYENNEFQTYKRSEIDEQGNNNPMLYIKLLQD